MSNDPHRIVESGYDRIAERYVEVSRRGRGPETYFRGFLDRAKSLVAQGGLVLDLGCGAGLIAAEFAASSRVVGVDLSARQLELARTNAPSALLVRGDISEVAFEPQRFDAVVAFWSLIHVRRELHASMLTRIHDWLRPGGLFAGTLGRSDDPDWREQDFFGAPMYWSHFDAETNRRLLVEAGFELVQADEIEDEGETPLWVIATASSEPRR